MKDSHIIIITWVSAMVCALLLVSNIAIDGGSTFEARHKRDVPAELNQALGITPAVQVEPAASPVPATETERVDLLVERMDEMNLLERDVLEFKPPEHDPATSSE